jgi:DNA-binding GntR family transcriptional regulator
VQDRHHAGAGRETELLSDRAYAALRDRLISLEIPPGAPIDEDALTRELAVGRTPVREAVRRLALEGLIVVYPRRGTFASTINITSLTDITDVRAQLEPSWPTNATATRPGH